MAGLDVLASTRARLRTSNHGRILLEMALVRLGRLSDLISVSQLAQAVTKGQVALAPTGLGGDSASKKKWVSEPNAPNPSVIPGSAAAPVEANGKTELTEQTLPAIWEQVLTRQGQFLRMDLEKAGFPAISAPNTLALCFPPGYNTVRDRCQDPEKVGRIEQLLQELTGQKCRLRIETLDGPPRTVPSAGIAEEPEHSRSRLQKPQSEAAEPPLVKWAKELLGAKPIKADPDFGAEVPAVAERAEPVEAEEQ
jgi:DNA polymerase-3 subunit gamma/tau